MWAVSLRKNTLGWIFVQLFWCLEDRFSKNTCLKFCLVCLVSECYRHKNESGSRFWEWATPSQHKEQEKVFVAQWHSIHMILETTNCLMVLEQPRCNIHVILKSPAFPQWFGLRWCTVLPWAFCNTFLLICEHWFNIWNSAVFAKQIFAWLPCFLFWLLY